MSCRIVIKPDVLRFWMLQASALCVIQPRDAVHGRMVKISYHCPLKQNFQLNQRLLQMMRYIKMFLTHVQTPLHCSNCQKSPISMFFWWFSERDEKQLRCLFQPQMLHSDAQCFFQPLKKRALPPSVPTSCNPKAVQSLCFFDDFLNEIRSSCDAYSSRRCFI